MRQLLDRELLKHQSKHLVFNWLYDTVRPQSQRVKSLSSFANIGETVICSKNDGLIACFSCTSTTIDISNRAVIPGHDASITGVQIHPSEPLFTTSSMDNKLKVWDYNALECVYEFDFQEPIYCQALQGSLVATGTASQGLRLADMQSGALTHTLFGHKAKINSVSWMPGREHILSSCSDDGTIRIWDVRKAKSCLSVMNHSAFPVNGITFSMDGTLLFSIDTKGLLRSWYSYSGLPTEISFPSLHSNRKFQTLHMAVTSTGYIMVPSDNGALFVYDGKGKSIARRNGHLTAVFGISLITDHTFLSGSLDGLLRWQAEVGEPKSTGPNLDNWSDSE